MTLTFTPGADFETVTDGLERADVTQRDGGVMNVTYALRRAVGHAEPEESYGDVRQADTVWHLPVAEMADRPDLGALLTSLGECQDEDLTWVVLSVAQQTLRARWRCVCRVLDVRNVTATVVTIQSVTYSKGSHGESVETWADSSTGVRAKIHELNVTPAMEHSAWKDEVGYRIFFETDQTLGRQYRVVDSSSNTYRVLRVSQGYSWGSMQVVDAEKI